MTQDNHTAAEWLPADDATRGLIARAQAGDEAAREQIVAGNLRLVRSMVARFAGGQREPEDLFQIGCIGLLKAVDRFDLRYPVRFSTYAVPLILGEIRRHLRDDGLLRVSRGLKSLAQQAHRAQEHLAKEYGREPSLAEVALATGAAVEDVVEALECSRPMASMHEPIFEGEGEPIYLGDQIQDRTVGDAAWLDQVALREGLARLDAREREILLLRYFRDKTQMEVARILGISQVQVSRLERRALGHIRTYLTGTEG